MNSRLLKEIKACSSYYPLEFPLEDTMRQMSTILEIPKQEKDHPFHGGSFILDIRIPNEYPNVPPLVVFQTPIFHPNIHFTSGQICLSGLSDAWTPALTLKCILDGIIQLMLYPNPDSPLNCDASNLLKMDSRGYKSLARMYTLLYAMPLEVF